MSIATRPTKRVNTARPSTSPTDTFSRVRDDRVLRGNLPPTLLLAPLAFEQVVLS